MLSKLFRFLVLTNAGLSVLWVFLEQYDRATWAAVMAILMLLLAIDTEAHNG